MRNLIGELLAEIQRIKSEGDFDGARDTVENYGVKVNPDLHKEILERYATLKIAPYKGFVNPYYQTVKDASGNITDIVPQYTESYAGQMLRYATEHSHLPTYND
jgi:dipeptidyl-peptidase-3